MTATPAQVKILTGLDTSTMTLDGLLVHFNELAEIAGVDKRNAKFRDKPTGVKAIKGLLVQISATPEEAEEAAGVSPGLKRLRAAPQAEAIREAVLEDQKKATKLAKRGRDGAVGNESEPVPVKERRGRATFSDDAQIEVLVAENPKRKGTACYTRFEKYGRGCTVGEYARATGDRRKALQDVAWDVEREFVRVTTR